MASAKRPRPRFTLIPNVPGGLRRFRNATVYTVPAAFVLAQWTLTNSPSAGANTLTINIVTLPGSGGIPVTALQYRLNTGAPIALAGLGTGARNITVPTVTLASVEVRSVNSIGPSAWSDVKTALPTI